MLTYEYKLDATPTQRLHMDEAIRIVQFVRNKCLRLWMDGRGAERGISANDLQAYCSQLAKEFPFAARLNSQSCQAAADRAWAAISRFYKHCREHTLGKKGYPRFQHHGRSVEYKVTGWTLDPDGKHLTWSDECGIGRVRLIGTREIASFPLQQIKRVRLVRRADGYYAQFVVEAERRVEHRPTGKQVGIDVGLNAYYTDSRGATVENPRYLRQSEQRIQMLSRRLSRKSIHHQRGRKPKHNHAARQRAKQNKYPRQTMSPVATATQETSVSVSAQDLSQRARTAATETIGQLAQSPQRVGQAPLDNPAAA